MADASLRKLIQQQITEALTVLRAPVAPPAAGGVKDEAHWMERFSNYTSPLGNMDSRYFIPDEVLKGLIGHIQADAIASVTVLGTSEQRQAVIDKMDAIATQPEARPLRQLIAEGVTDFWVWVGSKWIYKNIEMFGVFPNAYSDCPAIPIIKPTVTK